MFSDVFTGVTNLSHLPDTSILPGCSQLSSLALKLRTGHLRRLQRCSLSPQIHLHFGFFFIFFFLDVLKIQ